MQQVLYFHVGKTTFIRKDIEIFQQDFNVREFMMPTRTTWKIPLYLIRQFFFLLTQRRKTSLMIVQFAGYHTLLPTWLGKKWNIPVLMIASGTESARYPSINYGNYRKKLYGWFTKHSVRLATHISPVHSSLIAGQNHYYPDDGVNQGMEAFAGPVRHKATTVPYGFDADKWTYTSEKKPNTFLTVAIIDSRMRYILKGGDLILAIAPHFPDCQFTIVGMKYQPEEEIPSNVQLLPPVKPKELRGIFAESEFYFQLSISEGHPNALCEGMISGCIPIGSAVTAIPDIIADTGYILEKRDVEQLKDLVQTALKREELDLGHKAYERIKTLFPHTRRSEGLLGLAHKLIQDANK